MTTDAIRLLTRGDDAGSSANANQAIGECCTQGVLRNVSVMVPGPAFAEAAALFRDMPGIDIGLHITLNAEWDAPKWRPVLPREQVPTLVDAEGWFWPTPRVARERGAQPPEMLQEIAAQLRLARDAGLPIAYIDEHMGVSSPWPELRAGIADLCRREGLIDAHSVPFAPIPAVPSRSDSTETLLAVLAALTPGTYRFVTHPMTATPDIQGFTMPGVPAGQIVRERDGDRRALQDSRVLSVIHDHGIEVIRYTEAAGVQ